MRRIATSVAGLLACLVLLVARSAVAVEVPQLFPDISDSAIMPEAADPVSPGRPEAATPDAADAPGGPAADAAALPRLEVHDPLPAITTIDLTASHDDLWHRIRLGFAMPDLDSSLVQDWQAWYLSRPDHLKRVVERSRRYLYHIVEELEQRGMPTELALLPIVESAFNPMANSSARASGIWQFIPSTGKIFKLEQNWWVDQRRDIIASTSAALDYLQYIYEMHGDWHLTLASYNWGEGAVGRAIAKNETKGLPTDYLSLAMPAETRNYVPKLQAIKNIVAFPEMFNVNLEAIPNQPYFAIVEKPADMDVAVAAQLAEMPIEEFMALNPAYKRPVMPAGGLTSIVLPSDRAEIFQANLADYDEPLLTWQAYKLKKGERLDKVAAKFGISVARLRQVNGISPKARVRAGSTLLVPAKGKPSASDLKRVDVRVITPVAKKKVSKRSKRANPRGRSGKPPAAKSRAAKPSSKSRSSATKTRRTSSRKPAL